MPDDACTNEGLDRRQFLQKAVTGAMFGVAAQSGIPLASARRTDAQANQTPEAALQELVAGNQRFAANRLTSIEHDLRILKEHTVDKQEPFAAVLACADSRVPVELVFDQTIGHIFGVTLPKVIFLVSSMYLFVITASGQNLLSTNVDVIQPCVSSDLSSYSARTRKVIDQAARTGRWLATCNTNNLFINTERSSAWGQQCPGSVEQLYESKKKLASLGLNRSTLARFSLLSASSTLSKSAKNSTEPQDEPQAESEAQELAKKLSNPVASLISVPFQSNFDFGMGSGSGWRYTLNFQPVIPVALGSNWNLISRTIVPIIHQGNVVSAGSGQSGLGDIVQSLFFSPNKTEPLIWAVGPVFLIPTATNDFLGTKKFGLGPTVLGLKQKRGWTYGVLMNHIWSVAGSDSRADVNSTFIQPFLSYTNRQAWTYSINTESTYDWTRNRWSIPIHPGVAKLVRFRQTAD